MSIFDSESYGDQLQISRMTGCKSSREELGAALAYEKAVRRRRPLVHCITNTITIWDCANALLAIGASPTMAHHPMEVEEITGGCDALVLNLGAMNDFEAMLNALPRASALGHPVIVDPVGCGGSSFRRSRFWELAHAGRISCVRGNASEIRALASGIPTVTGVDAAAEKDTAAARAELEQLAARLAKALHGIVIASGPVDFLTDGERSISVVAGDARMSQITGSGCMSAALLGAFLTVENSLESAAACCIMMGTCGEAAASKTRREKGGTMTFHTHLIDELSLFSIE